MDQFVVKDLRNALTLDSLITSHPIITGATDPDEINSLFDAISYDKVWPPHISAALVSHNYNKKHEHDMVYIHT